MDFKDYIKQYSQNYKVYWAGGIPWSKNNSVIKPLSPPHHKPNFDSGEINKLLRDSKAHMAMWTFDFDSSPSEWWWIIAEKPYSLELLNKKARYNVRHGLKHCEVKIISASQLTEYGYGCYISAMRRHKQSVPLNKANFMKRMPGYDQNKAFQFWGVFLNDKLIGYARFKIIDNIVYQEDTILDPKYFRYHTSYALIHITTDYYLNKQNFSYITHGTRSISHDTEYQEFLIKNLNRRKAYSQLGLEYCLWFSIIIKMVIYLKPIFVVLSWRGKIKHKLEIIEKLHKIKQI